MSLHLRELLPVHREVSEPQRPREEYHRDDEALRALVDDGRAKKVLAVASGGGHWVQLQRMLSAFEGMEIAYVTTLPSYRDHVAPARFYTVCDASLWNKFRLLRMAIKVVWIVLREKPDLVISTGAAPGYFAIRVGKWIGARTVWVDSIANAEKLSLSGRKVGPYADLWLTQWPHLARPEGPRFEGAVL
jgi:UDP-N-acetylglucosamine:LPS N-acetylglucosamine transferase